jgi:DNA-3-methyladenine glycosylase I
LAALAATPASVALSRDLKRRGWTFVGPTTVYAFMQAVGLVNDHLEGCAVRAACERDRAAFRRPRALQSSSRIPRNGRASSASVRA